MIVVGNEVILWFVSATFARIPTFSVFLAHIELEVLSPTYKVVPKAVGDCALRIWREKFPKTDD